jgi:hypothetical protein
MRALIPLMSAFALGSCMAGPPSPQAAAWDHQQALKDQQELDMRLAGRVAGPPTDCLPAHRANNQLNISDNTILFDYGNTIYRNDPPGGCPGLGSGQYALVLRPVGSSLCRGEIAQVKDTMSGMLRGTCTLGAFVPYTRAP